MKGILHGVGYHTDCVTATLTTLGVIVTGDGTVKNFEGIKLAGAMAMSANCEYLSISNPDSFGGSDPAAYVPGSTLTGANRNNLDSFRPFCGGIPLLPKSQTVVKSYQASGGNQEINALLHYLVPKGDSIPLNQVIGKSLAFRKNTWAANTVADVWDADASGIITDLKPDKKYALLGCQGVDADLRLVRYKHDDFEGMTPMFPGRAAITNGYDFLPFCPLLSGSSDLTIECFDGTTETPTIMTLLAEI